MQSLVKERSVGVWRISEWPTLASLSFINPISTQLNITNSKMESSTSSEEEPPKLPLLLSSTFPIKPQSSSISTPPLNKASASIPFQWEEAPGVPRHYSSKPPVVRSLHLPPRLASSSPTTVLHGPYSRSMSSSRINKSSSTPTLLFASSRWTSPSSYNFKGTFDFSDSSTTKFNIRKRSSGSFRRFSHSSSHLWVGNSSSSSSFNSSIPN